MIARRRPAGPCGKRRCGKEEDNFSRMSSALRLRPLHRIAKRRHQEEPSQRPELRLCEVALYSVHRQREDLQERSRGLDHLRAHYQASRRSRPNASLPFPQPEGRFSQDPWSMFTYFSQINDLELASQAMACFSEYQSNKAIWLMLYNIRPPWPYAVARVLLGRSLKTNRGCDSCGNGGDSDIRRQADSALPVGAILLGKRLFLNPAEEGKQLSINFRYIVETGDEP